MYTSELAQLYDYERDLFLNYYGIRVLRFVDWKVFDEIEYVLYAISSNFGWWKNE